MASVELAGVSKLYGTTRAVDDVNLKIAAGSYCCLLGPSGCGKTSTLRMIAGHEPIARATSSSATGTSPTCRRPRGTAMMFQSFRPVPASQRARQRRLQPEDARRRKSERRQRARMLERVDMGHYAERLRRSFPAASSSAWRWRGP